jgi:hypothetical protein
MGFFDFSKMALPPSRIYDNTPVFYNRPDMCGSHLQIPSKCPCCSYEYELTLPVISESGGSSPLFSIEVVKDGLYVSRTDLVRGLEGGLYSEPEPIVRKLYLADVDTIVF